VSAKEPLSGVSKTALGVARVRAQESSRPDCLFNDPYAAAFLDAFPDAFPGERTAASPGSLGSALAFHAVIRTRFFDDYLRAACVSGCRQVVLLAAGLDTRAYRLAWPDGVRLFELDLPEVLTFKDSVLAGKGAVPRCARIPVPADVRARWPAKLIMNGFDASQPTAWLVEGLLIYLTAEEAARVLTAVGNLSAAGSRLSCERGNSRTMAGGAAATPAMGKLTSLWKGGLGEDAADWLARSGWQTQIHHLSALAASYGRPVPRETRSGFVTATYRTSSEPDWSNASSIVSGT
jgi:methyltransferase (TIGR00027 family)